MPGANRGAPSTRTTVTRWLSRYWSAVRHNVPYWPVMAYNLLCWPLLPRRKFFDPTEVPETAVITEHAAVIRTELDGLLEERAAIPGFQEVDPGQRRLTDDDRWKMFVFRLYGVDAPANHRRCPATSAVLSRVPDLYTAMFSILEPGKRIPLHSGPLKGLIRYHLPLLVPTGPGCTIQIGGEVRSWTEGEPLVFDDTYLHRVVNDTDEVRVVLFVDVPRAMPWPWLDRLNRWVLAAMARSPRIRGAVANAEAAATAAPRPIGAPPSSPPAPADRSPSGSVAAG